MFPLAKTLVSLFKARLIPLMLASAALAVAIAGGFVAGLVWAGDRLVELKLDPMDQLFTWGVGVLALAAGWFMLPALTVLLSSLFQEAAIRRVERAYYPEAGPRPEPKFWPEFWHDVRFTAGALLLNLLVLPLYTVGVGFVVSILLNSYLLGREFFETAAGYRLGKKQARALGWQHRRAVYGGGLLITLMTLVPLLNLFVPLLAVVWMVHVYHGIRGRQEA
ncbi:MAG: EI24 domain-containing protein [Chloroflexia bacterium]|nr:EI24 domain-containing protein [Chloroflexia bacterium]